MKSKSRVAVIGAVVMGLALPGAVFAQQCPPEVAEAKKKIASTQAAMKKAAPAKEVQAPRTAAGARGQDLQAPRGQEQQAPRGQEQQAPRGQEQQAPRGQEQQAPRGQEQQAPRGQEQQAPRTAAGARGPDAKITQSKLDQARKLVTQAEQDCKTGNMAGAKEKAQAALDLVK